MDRWKWLTEEAGFTPFTVGLVLLGFVFTMILLDHAAIQRAGAKQDALELEFRDGQDDAFEQLDEARIAVISGEKAIADAAKKEGGEAALATAQKDFEAAQKRLTEIEAAISHARTLFKAKRERALEEDVMQQRIDAKMNRYWLTWLVLPGMLLFLLGCVALLNSEGWSRRLAGLLLLLASVATIGAAFAAAGLG